MEVILGQSSTVVVELFTGDSNGASLVTTRITGEKQNHPILFNILLLDFSKQQMRFLMRIE